MKMKILSISIIFALSSVGCVSLAPDYERPVAPVAGSWPTITTFPEEKVAATAIADQIDWRSFFTDPVLRRLIEIALENNRDLRITALNVQKAQAMYRVQRANQIPTIAVSGVELAQRTSRNLSPTGQHITSHQYNVDAGISNYELDFFGRVASLKDQALETYLASENAWRSGQISLIANVAVAYLNLIADREHLRVVRDTLKNQQTFYDLIKVRFENGVASEIDLWQARTSVETSRVDVANYTTMVAQDESALVLLLGTNGLPEAIITDKVGDISSATLLDTGEVPSAILQRRPDIMLAEHLLKAANANIGAARAAFFPSISLTTTVGTVSSSLSGLFDNGSGTWKFSPQISLPIFDFGRNIANLDAAEASRDIALAEYEKAIQSAFREVANALVQRTTVDEQLMAQTALLEATTATHNLASIRYERGVDSYLSVLDAERSMYSANQGLVSMQQAKQINQVMLYKALGGGVDRYDYPFEEKPTQAVTGTN
ncbi:MAG: efflux transporter outer membrane subunit [Burkholderiales bacterium]|jgi:multidrug efflux system outer membrane protein|nr:efflux transporter outer membrane subunit [Burkholderiales bacterium]